MKYELIIFDADETLFDFKESEKVALESTMRDFNMEYDESFHLEIYKEINAAVWKELEKGLITQKELNDLRFQRLLERLDVPGNAVEFADTYIDHLSRASFLYEESFDLVRRLAGTYRLAILSNGLKKVQNRRLRQSAIAEYFKEIVISEEVGLAKPDPAIFELLFDLMGFSDKSRTLIVGDSLSSDIQGGVNFGIDTCWYNPNGVLNSTGLRPAYEIRELKDLYELL